MSDLSNNEIHLTAACDCDIEQILLVVRETSDWLKNKGIHQWSHSFPREILEREITRSELFVYKENYEVIGSLALSNDAGELWDHSVEQAIYLHRLVVKRTKSGQNLGRKLIEWVEKDVHRRGFKLLRLVCDAKNTFLQKYYTNLGYTFIGIRHFNAYNMDFARFEKWVSQ